MFGFILVAVLCMTLVYLFGFGLEIPFLTRPVRRMLFPLLERYVYDGEFPVMFCEDCGRRLMVRLAPHSHKYDSVTGKLKETAAVVYIVHCGSCMFADDYRYGARKMKEEG